MASKDRYIPVLDRFLDSITMDQISGHWFWNKSLRKGYASIRAGGKKVLAHRWAYEYFIADIPDGLMYRHGKGCPTYCVNPWHAREPGTQSQNSFDRVEDGTCKEGRKTHCPAGHPYDRIRASDNARLCSVCINVNQMKRYYARKD